MSMKTGSSGFRRVPPISKRDYGVGEGIVSSFCIFALIFCNISFVDNPGFRN